jgi:peptide chain release factor 2
MLETKQRLEQLKKDFDSIVKSLKMDQKAQEISKLEAQTTDPDFWNDRESAKTLMQKLGDLKSEVDRVDDLKSGINILIELEKQKGLDKSFEIELARLEKLLSKLKLSSLLSGEYDHKNAILAIHAGQGGVEAMDWTSMLYRMYLRFSERKGYKTETIDLSQGEEAGVKSVTFKVIGQYAYGYLKGESGTHRLVRQSPFNADKLRQTSFALVEVLPELGKLDYPDIELKDEDLSWQFFRSSTQGGQNVQKVSTAVRVKHIPTGIVVTSQTQRFQEQNRKIALELLRAKLWALKQEQRLTEKNKLKGTYKPASWGNQIRSYVLHPYKMVKDLRTGVETSNTEAVLNGDIDNFIEAELINRH